MSNEFKILVASDVHLGYNERHQIRGDDSFRAFEEILQAATRHDVDFILLAGDLFHINKPSLSTIRKAFALIRRHCFGEPKNSFQICNYKSANILDKNLKIRYPIFTIHGNHDDPVGVSQISSVDIFNTSGYVNYFGKRSSVEEISLKPIIMRKGNTEIALYGLGSMHEERLAHLIQSNKFNYLVPGDDLGKYFKILLVHQNRIPRPGTKYLNPKDLDELPDLVIWGHEHNCVDETKEDDLKFFILQPGSTVATSLCEAEAGEKYYFILNVIHKPNKSKPVFKCNKFRCETVRPFLFRSVNVDEILLKSNSSNQQQDYLLNYCLNEIKNLINNSQMGEVDVLPLIRLRIDYSDKDQLFEANRLENRFMDKVANMGEIVRFVKRSSRMPAAIDDGDDYNMAGMATFLDDDVLKKEIQVKTLMDDYFSSKKLALVNENHFTNKVIEFVQKGSLDILTDFFQHSKDSMKQKLLKLCEDNLLDLGEIRNVIGELKERNKNEPLPAIVGLEKATKSSKKGVQKSSFSDSNTDDDDDDDDDFKDEPEPPKATRGRGRGRGGKATTTSSTSTTGRKRTVRKKIEASDEEDNDEQAQSDIRAYLKKPRRD